MKKKLNLGKPTLQSIKLQITTILQPLFRGDIEITKIESRHTDTGNFVRVKFKTSNQPDVSHSRIFAMQRVHDCCDIWLETPVVRQSKTYSKGAA